MKRLYVGNLPYSSTETDIKTFFADYAVSAIKIITDRETRRPRGFAFIDIEDAQASKSIATLNGMDLGGRSIVVSEAKEKAPIKKASPKDVQNFAETWNEDRA